MTARPDLIAMVVQRTADSWLIALSHEPVAPGGRLLPDRDRYQFEPV